MQNPQTKKENRHFKRWRTSIPCAVLWEDRVISGEIANISFGGAWIVSVGAVPPVHAAVTVAFTYMSEELFTVRVECRIAHLREEAVETGGSGGFGVEFQEALEKIRPELLPLLEKLSGKTFPPTTGTWEPTH